MGSFNAFWCFAVMAIVAACLCTTLRRPPIRPTADFAQALRESGLATGSTLVFGCRWLLGSFLYCSKKGPPRCFWAPNLLGFAGLLLLVVPGPGSLNAGPAPPTAQRSGVLAGQCQSQRKLLVIGYMRYSVVYYSKQPWLL